MITVFGSINLDLVVAVPRLPKAGETVAGPDHQTFAGGKGANQALAARRAGADVKMVGAVGRDAFSEPALTNLREAGVDLSAVRTLDGTTGLAFIGIDPSGENQIIEANGANARIESSWLQSALSPQDTLLLQGDLLFDEFRQALSFAGQAGASVFWNPAPVPQGDLFACLDEIGTLVVNESEAAEIAARLGHSNDPSTFVDELTTPSRSVVVTLGAAGVVAGYLDQRIELRSPVIHAVDTTGAGDAFCGAMAAGLDQGADFERALKEGIAAGALACTATGAQSSAPPKEAIRHLADQIV
ncbi:MAG: ribokinase [Roseibium sp.]|uniref:ribokinase n=1 Tax=Roseibium sp. TaxID=1936156 RepID=UPI002613931E|nr:ribokinase [Roseibium sp.]MCV0424470.1 ribokinase [Roseibium sp.]